MPNPSIDGAFVRRYQVALIVGGVVAISAILLALYFWLRPQYQVMFSDLKPQDSATIVAALERSKTPYRLQDNDATILVPESEVHATRLKVMTEDLPLRGTVGFELFNNSDLGLTEFAQKVNYQRALQGELARTIMSLQGVDSARVHLSIPDSTLFRNVASKPKASVAIAVHEGEPLNPDTVRGIQRLVAAAVSDMEPGEVTVLDQTGTAAHLGSRGADDPQLQFKMDLESYYGQKLLAALEPIVGKDKVQVSVDASINFDQVKVTQESSDARGQALAQAPSSKSPAAVLSENNDTPAEAAPSKSAAASQPSGEREHSVRRMEQIVSAPGSIRRMTVGLLLQSPLDASTQAHVAELAAATIGAMPTRGDVVSIFVQNHALESTPNATGVTPALDLTHATPPLRINSREPASDHPASRKDNFWVIGILLALLIAIVGAAIAWRLRFSRSATLSSAQRAAMIARIKRVLAEEQQGKRHAV